MASIATTARRHAMWLCLYGPALSFLPPRWRNNSFARQYASWRGSTLLTASLEFIVALDLAFFYFGGRLQSPAVVVLALYLAIDGPWRAVTAHFEEIAVPTLVFAVADEGFQAARTTLFNSRHPEMPDLIALDDRAAEYQLMIDSSRAKHGWEAGRIIRCESRRGPEHDRYFRLESALREEGPRPFRYLLRALEAGVPGARVITYTGELPQAPQR